MRPIVRWLIVAVVAVALASAPPLVRAIPADESGIGATALAERIRDAHDLGWSGEVVSQGALDVPLDTSDFGGVARLLGESTELRVFRRTATNWRVDRLRVSGESGLLRDEGLVVRWTYEGHRVHFTPYSSVRLPNDADVVPVELAHRLLAGAERQELSRLPSRRIAGHSAAGLRLEPADKRSTISRVDVWAQTRTGLPLRVEVYGDGQDVPILSTRVTSLDLSRPSPEIADFTVTQGLDFSRGVALDDAAGANAFAPYLPPDRVADLPRRGDALNFGAVGIYGRGPTAILAIPLRDYVARGLREQLRKSTSSRDLGDRIALEVGPISVLLARLAGGNFLITGTVTPETLADAMEDLRVGVRRTIR